MRKSLILSAFLSIAVSTFSQSDEINISAAFSQSIELRVIGNASVNFTFSTIQDYQDGKHTGWHVSGFEVASSTSFEVQAEFTPFVSGAGDEIALDNFTYFLLFPDTKLPEKGVNWDIPVPDNPNHIMWNANNPHKTKIVGFFTAKTDPQTLLVPGPAGNAGDFSANTFTFQFCMGWREHRPKQGLPTLLDQNITPGTYTCTMTLTAIPSIT